MKIKPGPSPAREQCVKSICPVCQEPLAPGLADWHRWCAECGYEGAAFQEGIDHDHAHARLDEGSRASGLRELRIANFRELVSRLKARIPAGDLLEVGCAHGWFLDEAHAAYRTCGIEPDTRLLSALPTQRHNVRAGYFPTILLPRETFDVIVFNDVFEHLPNVEQALAACHCHLNDNGMILINLPSSRGLFYRLSKLLHRLGVRSPFERMWQKDLPSPHLHYFNNSNLERLLELAGFAIREAGTLRSIRFQGLYRRIAYANQRGVARNLAAWFAAATLLPFLPLFPSDIVYLIAQKSDQG